MCSAMFLKDNNLLYLKIEDAVGHLINIEYIKYILSY